MAREIQSSPQSGITVGERMLCIDPRKSSSLAAQRADCVTAVNVKGMTVASFTWC